jgi:hypothetical protein
LRIDRRDTATEFTDFVECNVCGLWQTEHPSVPVDDVLQDMRNWTHDCLFARPAPVPSTSGRANISTSFTSVPNGNTAANGDAVNAGGGGGGDGSSTDDSMPELVSEQEILEMLSATADKSQP